MGIFQVQAMAELLIRLSKKDATKKAKLVLYLRVATFSANLIVTVTMIVEAFVFVKVLQGFYGSCAAPWNTDDCYLSGFIKYMTQLGWISGTFYTILTTCLIATYVMLNK